MLLGYASRLIFQLGAFILIARALGPHDFGMFASAQALALLIMPFVELGAYSLVVQDATKQVPLGRSLGNSLLLSATVLPLGVLICILVSLFLLNVPLKIVLLVALSEFVSNRLISIFSGINIAYRSLHRTAVLELCLGIARLITAVIVLIQGLSLSQWLIANFLVGLVAGVSAIYWIMFTYNLRPTFEFRESFSRVKAGFAFSLGTASQYANNELDKLLLSRLGTLGDVGLYTSATRIIGVGYLPLNAYLASIYVRFFELGKEGIKNIVPYVSRRVLPLTVGYGLVASSLLWLISPFVSHLLGNEYADAEKAIRILFVIPLIQSIYFPLGDALTGSGHQRIRVTLQLTALALNIIGNLFYIPIFGWIGAAYSTIFSQTFLVVSTLLAIIWLVRRKS